MAASYGFPLETTECGIDAAALRMPTALILGAGMAGLTAGRYLTQAGWEVPLLDKGRGLGGRLATRRIGETRADHGAQYMTVRSPEFKAVVDQLLTDGVVHQWPLLEPGNPTFQHPRYVGTAGMNAVAKYLAQPLTIKTGQRVIRVRADASQWTAETETGETYAAEHLLVTLPAPQALQLLRDSQLVLPPTEQAALEAIHYQPCIAVMAVLKEPSRIPAPGFLRFSEGPVAWVADNTQKGISPAEPSVTVHASPAFSLERLEIDLDETARHLLNELNEWIPSESVLTTQVHRWRYSLADRCHPEPCLAASTPLPLLFGGDGFGQGNVEGAFLSGLAMGRRVRGEGVEG